MALTLANLLYKEKQLDIRVVSMPSTTLFDKQTELYQKEVLGVGSPIFTLEASSTFGWDRYATDKDHILGIDTFGVSGTKEEVLRATNFDFEALKGRIISQLKR